MGDCVTVEVNSLRKYVESSDKKLLTLMSKEGMLEEGKEKKEVQKLRRNKYRRKSFHDNFILTQRRGETVRPVIG